MDAQLGARGLVLKRGTLIDASLVEADADVRKGPDGRPVTVEREAGFARRRGKAFFGFKAHLAVDEGSGLVRRAILTPANVNESVVADALPLGDEAAVYADKGYDSAARHARLAERGVFDGIMRRGHRDRPLTPDEVARNRALVPIRSAIERVSSASGRSVSCAIQPTRPDVKWAIGGPIRPFLGGLADCNCTSWTSATKAIARRLAGREAEAGNILI